MPNVSLIIGGVTFADFEIPEEINFGGSQQVVVHKMIGGARQVNVLGADPDDIEWSGRFRGLNANTRAHQLDQMRIAGKQVTLSWSNFSYPVVISHFRARYLRDYEINYQITCVRVVGEQPPAPSTDLVSNLVSKDVGGIGSILSDVQDQISGVFSDIAPVLATASDAISQVSSALPAIGQLTGISSLPIGNVLTNLSGAQTAIGGAISIGDGNILTGLGQVGGVISGNASLSASNLTGQIAAIQSLSSLITARGLIGRTITNITGPSTPADSSSGATSGTTSGNSPIKGGSSAPLAV